MQPTKVVAAIAVCALVCVTALLSSVASASAATVSRDLPRREMNDVVFTNAKGWLIFKGNVEPGWNNRNIQVYKRVCKGCEWKLVKKVMTDGSGRWRTRIYAPRTDYWYWKGVVPRAGGYAKSVTQIYRTYVV